MPEHERYFPKKTNDEGKKTAETVETEEETEEGIALPEGREWTVKDIREVISPDFLHAISEASGGFSIVVDSQMGPGDPAGATEMKTKIIRLNPWHIREMTKEALSGLLTHEAGHHAPPVAKLDGRMVAQLGRKDILPKELVLDPKQEAEILRAINLHLCNTILDCFDEAFMGRRPHHLTRGRIESLYREREGGRAKVDFKKLPKPEQLCQILVGEDRYPRQGIQIKDLIDPDVYQVYLKLKRSGAVESINGAGSWEDYFATEIQHEVALQRKLAAFREAFLPAWLELFQAESKERQEEMLKQGGGQGEGGKEGKEGEGGKEGKEGEGKKLTPEQIKQILEALAKELQKLGEKRAPMAPSKEQREGIGKILAKILKGKKEKPESGLKPEESIDKSAKSLLQNWFDQRLRGLAENAGIKIESVRTWEEIKEQRKEEIETAAAQIADVFLEDRRKRLEYMRREGEIVPGMEYEYVAAVISGDLAPQTHMKQVQNPEFLETEVEFIQDVSGSMTGEPLRKCIELQVILAEAFRKVKQSLTDEQLLYPEEEEPLRLGVTKFETAAERVKKLGERMNDEMEMKIIDELTKGGGGTDEEQALTEVYRELTLHKKNILKIIVVLSDGHGNKEAVARIMQQIEEDDEVIVAAVGLGSEAKAVVEAYTASLRKGEQGNVHAFEVGDPRELLPDLLEFFRVEIGKRRKYL